MASWLAIKCHVELERLKILSQPLVAAMASVAPGGVWATLTPELRKLSHGKCTSYYQHDHQGGCATLEEQQRLTCRRFEEQSSSNNRVKSVKLPLGGQHRAELSSFACLEGVTTRAKARRVKRLEAPGPAQVGDEIVCSARQLAAA